MKELITIKYNDAQLRITTKWIKNCKYSQFNQFYTRWIKNNKTIEEETIEEIKETIKYSTDNKKKLMLFEEKTTKKINTELKKLINYISKQNRVYYQTIENSDKCMISDSFIVLECLKSDIKASKNLIFRDILEELYREEKANENGYLKPLMTYYDKASKRFTTSDSKALINVYESMNNKFMSDSIIKTNFKELIKINLDEIKDYQSYINKDNIKMKKAFIDLFKDQNFKYSSECKALYKNTSDYNLYAMTMKNN